MARGGRAPRSRSRARARRQRPLHRARRRRRRRRRRDLRRGAHRSTAARAASPASASSSCAAVCARVRGGAWSRRMRGACASATRCARTPTSARWRAPTCATSSHAQVEAQRAARRAAPARRRVPDRPGRFYPPTVLADVPAAACRRSTRSCSGRSRRSIAARDDDDAIALANDSPFGLGAERLDAATAPRRAHRAASCRGRQLLRQRDRARPTRGCRSAASSDSGYGRELGAARHPRVRQREDRLGRLICRSGPRSGPAAARRPRPRSFHLVDLRHGITCVRSDADGLEHGRHTSALQRELVSLPAARCAPSRFRRRRRARVPARRFPVPSRACSRSRA